MLMSSATHAQISFFLENERKEVSPEFISYFVDTSFQRDLSRYREIEPFLQYFKGEAFEISYEDKMLWVRLKPGKMQALSTPSYLMVRNPHINYLNVWLFRNDSLIKAFEPTGDRLPFHSRALKHPDFVFPLPENNLDDYEILLLIEKRNEIINIPVYLLSKAGFIEYNLLKNLTAGLFLGLAIFLLIFNLFLFFNMRDKTYIYYCLYIGIALYYIFSDFGFSFMYLFPDSPYFADYMRPISISLATPVYVMFTLELLDSKKNFPLFFKGMLRLIVLYLLLVIVAIFLIQNTGPIRAVMSGVSFTLINALMLGNIFIAWMSWRKRIRFSLYSIIASFVLVITVTMYSFYLSGDIVDNMFTRNLMKIAILTEVMLLTLVLSLRFKQYKHASERLINEVNVQQEKIFTTVSEYQEKELQRLSSLLHDSVGSRLSAIRLNLESVRNPLVMDKHSNVLGNTIEQIANLANEVRQFSHSISPSMLQKLGLRASIEEYVGYINQNEAFEIEIEWIGEPEEIPYRYALLTFNIVQELIQNIIRHAKCTEALLQIVCRKDLISIFIEDNGVGFDAAVVKDGLGLTQIRKLMEFVKGELVIKSATGNGTQISLEFYPLADTITEQTIT